MRFIVGDKSLRPDATTVAPFLLTFASYRSSAAHRSTLQSELALVGRKVLRPYNGVATRCRRFIETPYNQGIVTFGGLPPTSVSLPINYLGVFRKRSYVCYFMEYVLHPQSRSTLLQIDYESALNPEQLETVKAPPGPILVIAGAGSGKTRTLTYRVAYLVENGVEPENILLLTFTNKAAKEMLHRVGSLLPHDITNMWGGTFHHLGHRLLRRHANLLGYGQDFTIMDQDDSSDLAASCLKPAGLDPQDKLMPRGNLLLDMFGLALNKAISLATIIEEQYSHFAPWTEGLAATQRLYQDKKRASNVMDYDDLLALTLQLLRDFPELRERYQNQFQHVLVDEYQDTSRVQADLIDLLAEQHKQVMVVGDDAQSIYSWRGANFQNIINFPERYPGTKFIRIETNYRSTPEILNLANVAIAANRQQFKKELKSIRPANKSPKPALVCLENANQQSSFVAQRITELFDEGIELREIAILYRSHFHAMEMQMELTRRQIPFEVTSGMLFFEQAHVKDVSAYLRFALNQKDELAFKRVAGLIPGIGDKTADKLWQKVTSGETLDKIEPPLKAKSAWQQWVETQRQLLEPEIRSRPSEQIQIVIDAVYADYVKTKYPNFQNRLEDLNQLRSFAQTFDTTADFLAQLALLTNLDSGARTEANDKKSSEDKIRLSTVHQAKGLEWKVVFVIMLCDGLFPSGRAIESFEGEEEERRLFYVAVTRAKDELYLTYPMVRNAAGPAERFQEPSRFLTDLPRELTNQWKIVAPRPSWG